MSGVDVTSQMTVPEEWARITEREIRGKPEAAAEVLRAAFQRCMKETLQGAAVFARLADNDGRSWAYRAAPPSKAADAIEALEVPE